MKCSIPEVRNFTHFGDFQHIYFKYKTFLMIGNVLAEVSSIFFGGWPHMLGFLKISIMFRTELFTFLQTMKFWGSEQTALSWKQWDCKRWRDAKIVSTHIYIYIYQERKMFLSSRCCKESSSCWCLDLFAFSKQTKKLRNVIK